ncbi:hypothetical protein ACM26V_00390 [Salipaludibacillus sp. HK11]
MKRWIKKNKWILFVSIALFFHGSTVSVSTIQPPLRMTNWQWIE